METTFETPGSIALVIDVPSGDVHVRATDTEQTHVRIDDARDRDFEVTSDPWTGGEQRVQIRYRGKRSWFGSSEAAIEVECPLGSTVTMTTESADLSIDGRVGALQVRGGAGELDFGEVERELVVKTASGDVTGGTVGGDLTHQSASGEVRVRRVGGDMVAKTASGDLEIDVLEGSASVTSVSGDVVLRSVSGGEAEIRSVSGDVEVGVAPGTGVFLDLSATSGEVRSDLEMMDGPSGDGPTLDLKVITVSGDIRVRPASSRS